MKSQSPKTICVVIPNYNHGRYLSRCLDSILLESVLPDEVLVRDDGSTDNSPEILAAYQERFPCLKVAFNGVNRGLMWTHQQLVADCRSDYLLNLGADDWFEPGLVAKIRQVLSLGIEPSVIFFDVAFELVKENRSDLSRLGGPERMLDGPELARAIAGSRKFCLVGPVAWKTEPAREILSDAHCLGPLLDFWMNHQMAFRGASYYIPHTYSRFQIAGDSFSGKMNHWRTARPSLSNFLSLTRRPEYVAQRSLFRDSLLLSRQGWPGLACLLLSPADWDFLTVSYLKRTLPLIAAKQLRKLSPSFFDWLKRRFTSAGSGGAAAGPGD